MLLRLYPALRETGAQAPMIDDPRESSGASGLRFIEEVTDYDLGDGAAKLPLSRLMLLIYNARRRGTFPEAERSTWN